MKLLNILTGHTNNILRTNRVIEELAEARLNFCNHCITLDMESKRCKACGCSVEAKVRSPKDKCPLNYW